MQQRNQNILQTPVGFIPERIRLAVVRVGHDAGASVNVSSVEAGLTQRLIDQLAGEAFPKAQQLVPLRAIQLSQGVQIVKQAFQRLKVAAQFVVEGTVGRAIDQRVSQILMPHINIADRSEGRPEASFGCCAPCLQQLIGHARQMR